VGKFLKGVVHTELDVCVSITNELKEKFTQTKNRMERTRTARVPPPSPTITQNNKVKSVCFVTIGA